jgi:hypothetical protein
MRSGVAMHERGGR